MGPNELLFGGFFAFIFSVIVIIVFFVMASRIGAIRTELKDFQTNLGKLLSSPTYKCQHCGMISKQPYDFCPICDKNINGRTLQEERKDYQENLKKGNEKKDKFKL